MNFKVETEEAYLIEDNIWFFGSNCNGLFCLDKLSGEIDLIANIPGYAFSEKNLCRAIVMYNEYIVLPSKGGSPRINIYNRTTKEWKVIELEGMPIPEKYCKDVFSFLMYAEYEKYIYFFGHFVPVILRLDMESFEVEYITDWTKQIDLKQIPKETPYEIVNMCGVKQRMLTCFFTQGAQKDNVLYVPIRCGNYVLQFDLENMQSTVIKIDACVDGFNEATIVNDELWLVGAYRKVVVIYNLSTKEIREVELEQGALEETRKEVFYCFKNLKDSVLVFPVVGDLVYSVNQQTKEVSVHSNLQGDSLKLYILDYHGEIFYKLWGESGWKIYNTITEEAIDYETKFSDAFKDYLWRDRFKIPYSEDKEYTLEKYFQWIGNGSYKPDLSKELIGKTIWDKLKQNG